MKTYSAWAVYTGNLSEMLEADIHNNTIKEDLPLWSGDDGSYAVADYGDDALIENGEFWTECCSVAEYLEDTRG